MKIQTFKTNGITYKEPSIIWDVKKEDLIKIQYFQNMFEFSDECDEILLLQNVNDTEFKLIIDYINLIKNNECINEFIENLNNDQLLYFIKISDFFLIDDLLKILKNNLFKKIMTL
jgi:hypothetical protein|tara:strand:- start:102 stop:449 length:348 start_codon:yes stop_codon:yes gene_type:complete